ncbi:hypothetical protein VC83_06377 [Pseudogymnoascus destructans]|uniref:Uncharacterized protein n=2 Tax=Pseudogymnoascus destructans TaxID=655981 RepID=L8G9T2_PSED2|nr:uncharacterized protein VC83_06377 [Pseudogymnoascus destructans]ELR09975.1 hypothetical protein GMDG_00733 [Pseudogymnoascus destructans 20631-21]OAF58253.1 hypothetical protein VC83_06377 [Pseudogymnoascus destructans]
MPPKLTITGIPASFQSFWNSDSNLNRGDSPLIRATPPVDVFPLDDDSDIYDGDDYSLPTPTSTNRDSNIQGRPKKRQRQGEEEDTIQGKGRILSPEDYIILLKICLRMGPTYRSTEAVPFFNNVTADWQSETGKVHGTLRWVLQRRINIGQKYLENLGTGEQDGQTETQLYEDSWIEVLEADAVVIRQRKEYRGNIDKWGINPPLPSPQNTLPALQGQQLVGSEELDDVIVIEDDDSPALSPIPSPYRASPSPHLSSSSQCPKNCHLLALEEQEDHLMTMVEGLVEVAASTAASTAASSTAYLDPAVLQEQLEACLKAQEEQLQAAIAMQLEDL